MKVCPQDKSTYIEHIKWLRYASCLGILVIGIVYTVTMQSKCCSANAFPFIEEGIDGKDFLKLSRETLVRLEFA